MLFIIWRSYRLRYDTVIGFTGGLGSGKSLESCKIAIKLLKKNRRKVRRHNRINKFFYRLKIKKLNQWEKPQLYSSIPISISKKEMAVELEPSHLLLTKRIYNRSITFIDEIGSFITQFEYKGVNVESFEEFVRFYRHYTLGGYFVCNDQCSENIVLQVRRRINTIFNLMHFKKWFKILYTVKIRNISVSEEIKTIEEQDTEDNMTRKIGLMPFRKIYDTYCYSNRYLSVPQDIDKRYTKFKKNRLLKVPKEKITALTTNDD